jgi:hypothetical protein
VDQTTRADARIAVKSPTARAPVHQRLFDEYWTIAQDISAKSLILWRTRQDSNLWPLPSEGSALSS